MTDIQGLRSLLMDAGSAADGSGSARLGAIAADAAVAPVGPADDRPSFLARTRPAAGAEGHPSRALPPKGDDAFLGPHRYRSLRRARMGCEAAA